jgi:hypothetical protein
VLGQGVVTTYTVLKQKWRDPVRNRPARLSEKQRLPVHRNETDTRVELSDDKYVLG